MNFYQNTTDLPKTLSQDSIKEKGKSNRLEIKVENFKRRESEAESLGQVFVAKAVKENQNEELLSSKLKNEKHWKGSGPRVFSKMIVARKMQEKYFEFVYFDFFLIWAVLGFI